MLTNIALLILRIVAGLLFAGHGAQKLFGLFGGHGIAETAGWLEKMGIRNARLWAVVTGLCEFAGGLLFACGLLTPIGALALIAVMLGAIAMVHWKNGLWVSNGGWEYNLVLIATAVAVALAGPGVYSLDHTFGIALPEPQTLVIGAVLAIIGVLAATYHVVWGVEMSVFHHHHGEQRPA